MTNLTTLDMGNLPVERSNDMAAVEARETHAIQGMIVSARRFPRDQQAAFGSIMRACERPTLAAVAMYSYPRGGSNVTGPSIRLAQVIKQSWGNMRSGWRETERLPGRSKIYTMAWDLETNAIDDIEFFVEHVRETKKGPVALTDPRDIYEMIANLGRRRERSNILAIVPGDIVEAATEKCKLTLAKATDLKDAIPKMVAAFGEYGISVEQIEARIRRKLMSIGHTEFIQLRSIYQSLKDGMSQPHEWFEALHDPEKIKREQESTEPTPPLAHEVKAMDAERKASIEKFQASLASFKERGGKFEDIIKQPINEVLGYPAARLLAAAKVLESWKGVQQ